ncbi:phage holin family protein [Mangrovibacillus cuniculi]|uniref:Phage holin family protein n=2 Tax=Mangrovibacillus cuniculi TaxID=2593652 RepID=A0A7S8CEC0_9BACI|nr:phage holin family protein [Mangrovibacillus cuniculi]
MGVGFLSVVGGVGYSLFGEWSMLLTLLTVLVVTDYISGIIAAALSGTLSSKVGLRGIAKKILIFAFVAIAYLLDGIMGNNQIIRDVTIVFYICNEFISLTENAGNIGLPVPPIVKETIASLRSKEKSDK